MSLSELCELLELPYGDLRDDLQHLAKTLRHSDQRLVITPARCHKCGFSFANDKVTKPGKCPRCRGTWISEPLLEVRQR